MMSLIGHILKITGLYDKLKEHFVTSLLIPFAVKAQLSLQEAGFLGRLTRSLESHRPTIEIGTLFGVSTRIIAMNKHEKQKLYTVDNFCWNPCGLTRRQHESITRLILADLIENHCTVLACIDKEFFFQQYNDDRPALVFIDADHSYGATKSDIQWALSLKADVICGHDFSGRTPGVIQAVKEMGGIQEVVDSLWVLAQR